MLNKAIRILERALLKKTRPFRYVHELSIIEAEDLLSVIVNDKFLRQGLRIKFFKRFSEGHIQFFFTYLDFRVDEKNTDIIECESEIIIRDDFVIVTKWNHGKAFVETHHESAFQFLDTLNVKPYNESHIKYYK